MGMDSKRLSKRKKQPGHDQSFRYSEASFADACRSILPANEFVVREKPPDLAKMFDGKYGIVPEVSVEYLPTERKLYFEVKKQAKRGNAEERASKHHTVQFQKELKKFLGVDYHAFVTVMCEDLAVLPRYTVKHPYFFEPDHYFLWKDYDEALFRSFLDKVVRKYLKVK